MKLKKRLVIFLKMLFYTRTSWQILQTKNPWTLRVNVKKMVFCKLPAEEDDMIGCDDRNCINGCFHLKCLRIKTTPKGKWNCPDCKKKKQTNV